MKNIIIESGKVTLSGILNNSPTAKMIYDSLPIEGRVNHWGDEVYFSIPVQAGLEPDAREEMEVGELGYWPTGQAFCIFFGPTPSSDGKKPVAASSVNVLGHLIGDFEDIRDIPSGAKISITCSD